MISCFVAVSTVSRCKPAQYVLTVSMPLLSILSPNNSNDKIRNVCTAPPDEGLTPPARKSISDLVIVMTANGAAEAVKNLVSMGFKLL